MTQTITEITPPNSVEPVAGKPIPDGHVATVQNPPSLYDEIARRSDKLNLLLKGTDVSTERFIYAFQLEWNRNPKLQNCHRDSLIQAILRCAEMGLIPGVGAYLIPYNGTAQTQVSLQGWLTLLWRSGNVGNITHNLHREGDAFDYRIEQVGTTLYHKPKLEMDGKILGAYAMVTLKNHHVQFKYCNRKEIEASKENSKSKGSDSPWVKHFDQMAQIVPLRKLARILAPSLHEWSAEEPVTPHQSLVTEGLDMPSQLTVSTN